MGDQYATAFICDALSKPDKTYKLLYRRKKTPKDEKNKQATQVIKRKLSIILNIIINICKL